MVYKRVRGWNSGRSHWGRFEEKSSFLVLFTGAITNCVTSYKILKRLESHWTMPHPKTITNQQHLTATSRNTQENSISSKKTATGKGRAKEQRILFSPSSCRPLFFLPILYFFPPSTIWTSRTGSRNNAQWQKVWQDNAVTRHVCIKMPTYMRLVSSYTHVLIQRSDSRHI